MIESSLVFTTEKHPYTEMETRFGKSHVRKTIDGHRVGCSKCIGFCQYDGHPGFLTYEQLKKHDCIGKKCFYYISKPAKDKMPPEKENKDKRIVDAANECINSQEGIRFLDAIQCELKKWQLGYITITNDYSLSDTKEILERQFGCEVIFSKKQYSYERCIQLLFDM